MEKARNAWEGLEMAGHGWLVVVVIVVVIVVVVVKVLAFQNQ